jgi:hypothetical protein
MIISVINCVPHVLADQDIQKVIRAINQQIMLDFAPYWSLSAQLRLEAPTTPKPLRQDPVDMRGDAVVYLWDDIKVKDALGYHDQNHRGVPYGFVFPTISKKAGESWTSTLSHEALELIADPEANLYVRGPHPKKPKEDVFYWYEMCDAVQAETYDIDRVNVSNFVLPLYFTSAREHHGRNDFLNRAHRGKTLVSFGINPGGYAGYFDPRLNKDVTFSRKADHVFERRQKAQLPIKMTRRAARYQRLFNPRPIRP